MDRLLIYYQ